VLSRPDKSYIKTEVNIHTSDPGFGSSLLASGFLTIIERDLLVCYLKNPLRLVAMSVFLECDFAYCSTGLAGKSGEGVRQRRLDNVLRKKGFNYM
jgi:hypothetical protein